MNPDHELIMAFLAGTRAPRMIDTNRLAISLKAELVAVDEATGMVRIAYEPDAAFLQGKNVVQGGIVGTMLDFALAFAVLARLPAERTAATTSLSINFISAALAGRFVAEAIVDRVGGRMAYSSAKLFSAGERKGLIATATCAMAVLEQK